MKKSVVRNVLVTFAADESVKFIQKPFVARIRATKVWWVLDNG